MIMKKILSLFIVMLLFHGCSDPDGLWDKMKWYAEVPVNKASDGTYIVSADGETLSFICKNYSYSWLSFITCNGKAIYSITVDDDYHSFSTDWLKVEIEGRRLVIVFEANETDEDKLLDVDVTAGDIFYKFKFKQLAHN